MVGKLRKTRAKRTFQNVAGRYAMSRFEQRLMGQVRPRALAVSSPSRNYGYASGVQIAPRGQPAVKVVEVEIAAHVKDAPEVRQPQRVPQPGAAVHHGDAAHPIRVFVNDQEIEWPVQASQQRRRDVMKIAGSEKG